MVFDLSAWLGKPKTLLFTLPVFLLLFTIACGSAAAPVEPQVIEKIVEKEVIREVEVLVETIRV